MSRSISPDLPADPELDVEPDPMLVTLYVRDPADEPPDARELRHARTRIGLYQVAGDDRVRLSAAVTLRWTAADEVPPSHVAVLTPAGVPLFTWPIPHPDPTLPRSRGAVTLPAGFPMPVSVPI